jgi:flagella basal body P-ring formation protein FlgA
MNVLGKLFMILGLSAQTSFAEDIGCQIKFFQKTFFLGEKNQIQPTDLIETSSCSLDLQKKAIEVVLNSQGPLKPNYIKEAIGFPTVDIFPDKFDLISLESLIDLPQNWLWENLKTLSGQKIFHGNNISVNCPSCTTLGKKAIEVKIDKSTLWANGDLKVNALILVAKSMIPSNREPLSQSDFEALNKPVFDPEDYFTSLDEIKYYKLNSDLLKDVPLKKSNLRKIDLIKPGSPVSLRFVNGGISIKGTGMPLSSGKIGEMIKVKNQKTNAILFGKVAGENMVSVEL